MCSVKSARTGYSALLDDERLQRGLLARARFLVELDWGTHDLGSFGQDKIAAGLAYLRSDAYRARFGGTSGRWLVVTRSQARLEHLLQQAKRVGGNAAGAFLFTTLNQALGRNVLWERIWQSPEHGDPLALLAPAPGDRALA